MVSACSAPDAVPHSPAADDLTGGYVHHHVITHLGEKGWEEPTVGDTLSLRQVGDSLEIYLALIHTNYHICEMQTSAVRRGSGFESAPEAIEFGGEASECVLRVTATSDSIAIHDVENQCRRYYCGARGYIDGSVFPRR